MVSSDFETLSALDIRGNCKKAFDAGEILGISRVIEPADMELLTVPDKLAVMTYLYQLQAHFRGKFFLMMDGRALGCHSEVSRVLEIRFLEIQTLVPFVSYMILSISSIFL